MPTIEQIVGQIRNAVYGRDVRENIALGIETCYTDVSNGATLANTAANTANTKAELADTKAGLADEAATAANTAAGLTTTAIENAELATTAANTAAGKINNMTVEATGLSAGADPTATITEVEGHKNIEFGIPKGDTGSTPELTIGTVTTVGPTQSAAVTITGTVDEPIINFTIPRGYDGSSIMSNRIWTCQTAASTAAKTVLITTQNFTLEDGGLYIIEFANANTANSPTLNISSTGAKAIFINGRQITDGYEKNLLAGMCLLVYDGTEFNLIGNFYNESNAAISDSEIDALFS